MPSNLIEIQAFETIHALQECSTINALSDTLLKYIGNFGFEHFIISEMPPTGFKLEPHIIMQNWPADWYEHYLSQHHYDHDPVARCLETTMQPYRWSDLVKSHQCTPRQKRVMCDATEFGLNDGFIIPIYGASLLLNCVSYSGAHVELPPPAPDALYMVSMYAHESARALMEEQPQPSKKNTNLTRREREILAWVANGKTDAEIAIICNISAKTAGHHVANAIRKLNVVNRTQAVAHAIMSRQITL